MNKYFHIEYDDNRIAWLHFDQQGASANTLSPEALEALDHALITIAQSHPAGLVILSDKPSGFIAGADVKAFTKLTSEEQAEKTIGRAHDIFGRLEALSIPTVALIHGFCLGGGLELALACRYRLARNDQITRLGFPEVQLGIFPGFGGTVRAVRTLGHLRAIRLMLSGRSISWRTAERVGLVDYAGPERQLRDAAAEFIRTSPPVRRPTLFQQLPGLPLLRPLVASVLKKQLARHVRKEHYPAPYRLIDHWTKHAGNANHMYKNEVKTVAQLLSGDTAHNLIRVFMLQEALKQSGDRRIWHPGHVHVVGGGLMGGDIAAWCAFKGMRVTLQDRAPKNLCKAIRRTHELLANRLKDPYLVQAAKDRLTADHNGYGLARADVVIEAIFEETEVKRTLFADLEQKVRKDALLASNTSSIPLQAIAEALARPERLVGLHFFNPVARMPLVEVVSHQGTDPGMAAKASAFARHIGKLPLPVRSKPGFLVNRVLLPYLLEAVELVKEGVPAEVVDQAALEFGMPVGPIELADTVGLDICLSVARELAPVLQLQIPDILLARVEAGDLGRKSGSGFYQWKNGRAVKSGIPGNYQARGDITERLILRLINQAVACLREGIVENEDMVDAGIIFGTGFPPFRGGPMRFARETGSHKIQNQLQELEYRYGGQFHADEGWALVS